MCWIEIKDIGSLVQIRQAWKRKSSEIMCSIHHTPSILLPVSGLCRFGEGPREEVGVNKLVENAQFSWTSLLKTCLKRRSSGYRSRDLSKMSPGSWEGEDKLERPSVCIHMRRQGDRQIGAWRLSSYPDISPSPEALGHPGSHSFHGF